MTSGFRLLLILLLVLTGQSLAAARGQAQIAGEVVLCAGELTRVITVDADGRPVHRVTICPDMAPGVIDALTAAPVFAAPLRLARALETAAEARLALAQPGFAPQARDPPHLS